MASRRRSRGADMEASSSCFRRRTTSSRAKTPIHSLDADLLCGILSYLDHFDPARCLAVCKSWSVSLLSSSKHKTLNACLEELALEQHRLSLQGRTGEVHQWNGRIVRQFGYTTVNDAKLNQYLYRAKQCCMKMGSIVTGVGDKVVRMWSSESYKLLGEYPVPDRTSLLDFDFDESKIVGLIGTRMCIWRHHGKRSMFPSKEGTFARGICMRYADPEAVIGCVDGTVRVFDMYSQRCSRIIRMDMESVTSLALTDDQMIIGGDFLGRIKVADLSSGQRIANLKTSTHPTALVVGGIDGVLRVLDQNTGNFLSSYITDEETPSAHPLRHSAIEKKRAKFLPMDADIDSIPTQLRPSITCLTVGMRKVVTTHNNQCIRMWKFRN
ncbi:hypothetical protein ACLOJK_014081 [Asimina triloba]